MQLNTKHFGEITVEENDILTFEEGLPGFDSERKFILLSDGPNDLFSWLQSAEDGDLAFVLMDIKQILPDYDPKIPTEMLEGLGEPLCCYNIAVVPENLNDSRVNLKAPILINKQLRKGKQVIASNEEYSIRHYIFEEAEHDEHSPVSNGTAGE